MAQNVLALFSFSLILLSLIVVFEIIINFKKPFTFKLIFVLVILCIGIRSGGVFYAQNFQYNKWVFELPSTIMLGLSLSFFSIIYESKTKVYIIFLALLMVLIHIGILSYFTFINPVKNGIYLKDLPEVGFYINSLKIFFGSIIIIINGWLCYNIYSKFQNDNLYFAKLRVWSLIMLTILFLLCINNFFKNSQPSFSYFFEFITLIGHFSILLTFLFRPVFLNRTNLRISLGSLFTNKSINNIDDAKFMELFFNNLYFLSNESSVEDLRKKLNATADELTNYVYIKYGLSVNDFINKNRINYFTHLINTGKFEKYTIDALAQKAGFNSRFHLYKSFKKFHGGTPSEYLKSVHT
jgi:AraC-like DNA-binding protein